MMWTCLECVLNNIQQVLAYLLPQFHASCPSNTNALMLELIFWQQATLEGSLQPHSHAMHACLPTCMASAVCSAFVSRQPAPSTL